MRTNRGSLLDCQELCCLTVDWLEAAVDTAPVGRGRCERVGRGSGGSGEGGDGGGGGQRWNGVSGGGGSVWSSNGASSGGVRGAIVTRRQSALSGDGVSGRCDGCCRREVRRWTNEKQRRVPCSQASQWAG